MQLIRNSDGSSGSCITALINVCHNTVDRLTRQSAIHEGQTIRCYWPLFYRRINACGLPALFYKREYLPPTTNYE